jgi:hypothetical protein
MLYDWKNSKVELWTKIVCILSSGFLLVGFIFSFTRFFAIA